MKAESVLLLPVVDFELVRFDGWKFEDSFVVSRVRRREHRVRFMSVPREGKGIPSLVDSNESSESISYFQTIRPCRYLLFVKVGAIIGA